MYIGTSCGDGGKGGSQGWEEEERSGKRTKKGDKTGLRQKRFCYNRQFEENALPHVVLYTVFKNIEKMSLNVNYHLLVISYIVNVSGFWK